MTGSDSNSDPTLRPEAVSAETERLILDTADEGFCLFSAEGDSSVIAYNQRFADIFGFDVGWLSRGPSAEELAGAIFERQKQTGENKQEHIERVMRRHETRGSRDLEIELTDGRFVTGRTQAGPSGERLYTFRDVTSERRVLDQLRLERARLAALVEHAPLAFFLINTQTGQTVHVSRSIANVTGRDPAQFLGPIELWERDVVPEDRAMLHEALKGAVSAHQPFDLDYRCTLPDGTARWLRSTAGPLPGTTQADAQIAGVIFDITRRKSAEERLRSSERRFRDLVENVADFIFYEHDTNRVLTYVSPSAERMLGFTLDELIGHRFGESHPETDEADLALAHKPMQEAIRTGRPQPPYEVVLRHKSGEPVHCEISEYPVVVNGQVVGFHGVARDVTEIRAIQQRLRERERLAILGTFAGGLAHDLNNLLLPIRAGLDVLEREQDLERVGKRVASIRLATDHIAELTSRLLMWTRQESTEPTARSSLATNVRQWADAAIPFYRDVVVRADGEPPIDVKLDWRDPPALARIDGDLLKQAILNLFLNARDAMPEGGNITMRIGPSPRGWNEGDCDPAGTTGAAEALAEETGELPDGIGVRFSVIDSGHGMNEAVVRRAFDPFFSTKARGKSTGLGLALVASIIRSAGGQVQIQTRPGGPTTIVVDVPGANARKEAGSEQRRSSSPSGSVVVSLSDPRAAAFVRTGLLARGLRVRSGIDERPSDDDQVWVVDTTHMNPRELESVTAHRKGLTVVGLGNPDDQSAWPEGILWLEGSISELTFGLIVNAARSPDRTDERSEA